MNKEEKNGICEKEKAENKWGSEHSNAKILSNYLFNWVKSPEKDKLSGVHIWWESLCHGSHTILGKYMYFYTLTFLPGLKY